MTNSEVRAISTERLAQMREAGIKFVSILGSPNPGENCKACESVQGQKIEIDFATALPLPECDQEFCKCVLLAEQ